MTRSAQASLFSHQVEGPEGLRYYPDFISAAEERALIGHIEALPLTPFQFGAFEGKRRVAWFGWRYDYGEQALMPAEALPGWIEAYAWRVEDLAGVERGSVAQILCTEYEVGVGIGWHRDKKHFDEVFGLSLGAPCKLRLRRKAGAKWERFALEAEPRSLYMLRGEARHQWEHSIPPVERRRHSITFRTMASGTGKRKQG